MEKVRTTIEKRWREKEEDHRRTRGIPLTLSSGTLSFLFRSYISSGPQNDSSEMQLGNVAPRTRDAKFGWVINESRNVNTTGVRGSGREQKKAGRGHSRSRAEVKTCRREWKGSQKEAK